MYIIIILNPINNFNLFNHRSNLMFTYIYEYDQLYNLLMEFQFFIMNNTYIKNNDQYLYELDLLFLINMF